MISNATPLIALARIQQLTLLKKLFNKIIIPADVKEEVLVEGKQGYFSLKKAIDDGSLVIEDPKKRIDFQLGKGETAALSLAKEKKDTIILDDAAAIKAAEAFSIPTMRTTAIFFHAFQKKILTAQETELLLQQLVKEGYYIAPRHYVILLGRLRTFL